MTVGGKHVDPVKNIGFYCCMTIWLSAICQCLFLSCRKPLGTLHKRTVLTHMYKTRLHFSLLFLTEYIAYWSQARTVGCPHRKPLTSSTTNSLVIINVRWRLKSSSLGDIKDLNRFLFLGLPFVILVCRPYKTRTNSLYHITNSMLNECTYENSSNWIPNEDKMCYNIV